MQRDTPPQHDNLAPAKATVGTVFVSYRRSRHREVDALCELLHSRGVGVWLDRDDVEPLDDFPPQTRAGLADSHAVLVWWCEDYAASEFCMQEFRLAWQFARRRSHQVGQRIWIVNPHDTAGHIAAGDLGEQGYLPPPGSVTDNAWADELVARLSRLLPTGTLSEERGALERPTVVGLPVPTRLIGRGPALMWVHSALFPAAVASTASLSTVHLHGMAGIGKTALAAAYADTFALAYPAGVWWFNIAAWRDSTFATLEQACDAWLHALCHGLRFDTSGLKAQLTEDAHGNLIAPLECRQRIARMLAHTGKPYLWVLDNVPVIRRRDQRDEIVAFLSAPSTNGRTLVTCRDPRPFTNATPIRVPSLTASAGEALLTSYIPPGQRAAQHAAIVQLSARVGAHSLALSLLGQQAHLQAASYERLLAQVIDIGAVERLEQLHARQRATLGHLAPSIRAVLRLCLKTLDRDARRILALASVCAPYLPIPVELLLKAFGGADREDDFADGLERLRTASLIEMPADSQRLIAVHDLVARVTLMELRRVPDREQWSVIDALIDRFEVVDDNDAAFNDLGADMPHAKRLELAADGGRRARLLTALARCYSASGRLDAALAAATEAAHLAEQSFEPTQLDCLRAKLALSVALADIGDLPLAASLQAALVDSSVSALGPFDPNTLTIRSCLAETLVKQHRYQEAEAMQRDLLAINTRLHDAGHPHALSAASALAATLFHQGRYHAAHAIQVALCEQVIDLHGDDSADALITTGNLAATELALNRAEAALVLLRRVVERARVLYAEGHPTLQIHLVTLANALANGGDEQAAWELHAEVLANATRHRGRLHPDRIAALGRLVAASTSIGLARDRLQPLLDEFTESVGSTIEARHPQILDAVEALAAELHHSGHSMACMAPLLEQVLYAREQSLGPLHLETVRAVSNLALALSELQRWPQVIALRRTAVDRLTAMVPLPNADLVLGWVQLSLALRRDGQEAEAANAQAAAEACVDVGGVDPLQ